ncbi:hypothetical protein AAC387_Pa08g0440 [Persea americana]
MKCSAATVRGIYKRGRGSSEPVRVREKHWLRGSDSGGAHDTTGGIQTHRNGTFSIVLDIVADQDLGRVGGSGGQELPCNRSLPREAAVTVEMVKFAYENGSVYVNYIWTGRN